MGAGVGLESALGAAHVIQELFIGLDGRAALPGMLKDQPPRPRRPRDVRVRIADRRRAPGRAPGPGADGAPASLDAAPAPARLRRFRDPLNEQPREAVNGGPPLVYVSFGSEAPRSRLFPDLYREVIHALAALPIRLLVTIGDHRDPAELGPLPASVRVERWVSQAEVMPHAAAMVGHGGSGSTLMALAAGVPLALIPLFVDGPENAAGVAKIGAGIVVGRDLWDFPTPSPRYWRTRATALRRRASRTRSARCRRSTPRSRLDGCLAFTEGAA